MGYRVPCWKEKAPRGPFLDRKRDLVAVGRTVIEYGQHQELVDSLGECDLLHGCVAWLGSWSGPRHEAAMCRDPGHVSSPTKSVKLDVGNVKFVQPSPEQVVVPDLVSQKYPSSRISPRNGPHGRRHRTRSRPAFRKPVPA